MSGQVVRSNARPSEALHSPRAEFLDLPGPMD